MLMQVLIHTPRWVFMLFVVLLYYGLTQLVTRHLGLLRASLLPLAMVGWSLHVVATSFATSDVALLSWAAAAAPLATLIMSRPLPAGTSYDAAARRFSLPGSVVPLALMMSLFAIKFAVGVSLVMVPQLRELSSFALSMSALYGGFSGIFLGRALRLWKLALRSGQAAVAPVG